MLPSQEKLEKIKNELQMKLRIMDWDIKVEFVSEAKMRDQYGKECSGGCLRKRDSEEAFILINKDNQRICEEENYWYHTLLHELYHVVTDSFIYVVDDSRQYISDENIRNEWKETTNTKYEELVNKLAKGFVNAYPVTNFIKEGD